MSTEPNLLSLLDLSDVKGPVGPHLPRPDIIGEGPVAVVREIIAEIREGGDAALLACTERFDGVALESPSVDLAEAKAAAERIDPELRVSLEVAADRIRRFHEHQIRPASVVEHDGVTVTAWDQPLGRAGCYVPGGRAAYPSTVLMTAVIAKVAGVPEVVLTVPPGPDGKVPDVVLAAAHVAGVDEICSVGGAQAIAALAHGTETLDPVDVIVGPGNVFVSLAKREVAGIVAVPSSFPGPSEVVVVADAEVPAELAAIDIVLQAEHGPDGLAWLVCWDEDVAVRVGAEVHRITAASPRRAEIESTLSVNGRAVLCSGPAQALAVVDEIAPEHAEFLGPEAEELAERVRNAGAVFKGVNAPASFGDYLAGPSHVLPTDGTARFASALGVNDFTKHMHIVEMTDRAVAELGPHLVRIAEAEGLDAHADSVRRRLDRASAQLHAGNPQQEA